MLSTRPSLAMLLLGIIAGCGILRVQPSFDPGALLALDPEPATSVFCLDLPEGLDDESIGRLHALAHALRETDGVDSVDSLTTSPMPHIGEGDLDAMLALMEAQPSRFEGGLAAMGARVGGEFTVGPIGTDATLSEEEREQVRRAASVAAGALIDHEQSRALVIAHGDVPLSVLSDLATQHGAELTGRASLEAELASRLEETVPWMVGIAILLTCLVLAIAVRSFVAVMVPMAAGGLTLAIAMGAYGWLERPFTLMTAIVPPLLLTIAIGDSIHLIHRFSEEREHHGSAEASRRARDAMIRACFATTFTTAAGFAGLFFASSTALRDFAALAVGGVFVAFAVVVVLVPVALARSNERPQFVGRSISRLASATSRHRVAVAVLVLAGVAVSAAGAVQIQTDSRLLSSFRPDDPSAELARSLEQSLSGFRRMRWVLRGPDRDGRAKALVAAFETRPGILGLRSTPALLGSVWSALADGPRPEDAATRNALIRLSGPAARELESPDRSVVHVALADLPAADILSIASEARSLGVDGIDGEAYSSSLALTRLHQELTEGFVGALAAIFIALLWLFGVRYALAIAIPNLIPLVAVLGWMGLRDIPFDVTTAMVFAVTLGLIVDGTIHIVARHRELLESGVSDPLVQTYRRAGPPMIASALTLLVGFISLQASGLVPLARFAELATVSIAMGLLAEVIILPALLPRPQTDAD